MNKKFIAFALLALLAISVRSQQESSETETKTETETGTETETENENENEFEEADTGLEGGDSASYDEEIPGEEFDVEATYQGEPFDLNSLLNLFNNTALSLGEGGNSTNQCYLTFKETITKAVQYYKVSGNTQFLDQINKDIALYKSDCGVTTSTLFAAFNKNGFLATSDEEEIEEIAEDLETVGVDSLITSNCARDFGGELVILSSILADYKDVENDVFATIFLAVLGYQGYQDCLPLIQIIQSSYY